MNNPIFSILIPVYNTNFLNLTLQSLFEQAFKDYEVIINLDNPSELSKYNKIKAHWSGEKRFKFIKNKKNLGTCLTQKKSLKLCKGKHIVFQAEDNLLNPNFLKEIKYYIDKKTNDNFISFCGASMCVKSSFRRKKNIELYIFKVFSHNNLFNYLLVGKSAFFAFDTVCISRDLAFICFEKAVKFRPIEDLAMVLFALQKVPNPTLINKKLVVKIYRKNSYSSKIKFSEICDICQVLSDEIKHPIAKLLSKLLHSNVLVKMFLGVSLLVIFQPILFGKIFKQRILRTTIKLLSN